MFHLENQVEIGKSITPFVYERLLSYSKEDDCVDDEQGPNKVKEGTVR